jgi:hypothetical protein
MAKKGGSGTSSTSKGIHSNVSKSTLRGMRAARSEGEKMINKQDAWLKGKNPWITIKNPNEAETDKRYIKVRMNDMMKGSAKDLKKKQFIMK